eukprot:2114471-Rhodomonas_salina.3
MAAALTFPPAESPIAPAPMRRRRWKPGDKPPPLLAVPEEVPGQPVVAGAVMSGTQVRNRSSLDSVQTVRVTCYSAARSRYSAASNH